MTARDKKAARELSRRSASAAERVRRAERGKPTGAPAAPVQHVSKATLGLGLFGPSEIEPGPAFARHETFAPRAGWIRKGFVHAKVDHHVFLADDAHLRMGVGKNMGRAIRYWCHATGVLEDVPLPGGRTFASRPTPLGTRLLDERGWDPYLEDPGSLWLLHWQLVKSPALATAWHFAFTVFPEPVFDVDGLVAALAKYTVETYPRAGTANSSFKKDASCVVRMYAGTPSGVITEETIQSPFTDLGLVRPLPAQTGGRVAHQFEVGRKPNLDAAIVAAACLDYAMRVSPGTKTLALSRLLVEPGSPGMAFKLGEASLVSYLEEAAQRWRKFALADAAGLVQIAYDGDPQEVAELMLDDYFRRSVGTATA